MTLAFLAGFWNGASAGILIIVVVFATAATAKRSGS